MKRNHILLEKAYVYPQPISCLIKESEDVKNAEYHSISGFWVMKNSKMPAIEEPTFSKPRSKKRDIETGEDQKGE